MNEELNPNDNASELPEPVAWAQLGLLNGRSYIRFTYDRQPYPPNASLASNLHLKPLFTADQIHAHRAEADVEIARLRADALRLDWIQENYGCNLISDDGGKWALSTSGMQPVPEEGGFTETVGIHSIVGPEEWRESVRAAIDAAIAADAEGAAIAKGAQK